METPARGRSWRANFAARTVSVLAGTDREGDLVSTELMDRARAGDEQAFGALVGPHRRELQVHCYRILGSALDAEDALQETLLAAWQGLAGFEGRSSLRVWLFQI